MRLGQRRIAAMWMAATLVMTLVTSAAAAPSSGDDEPSLTNEPSEEPKDVARSELAALKRARETVAARMAMSSSAEYARRQAEAKVVEAHGARLVAQWDYERAVELLDLAGDEFDEARTAEYLAQEHFDQGVAISYKFGGAQTSALILAALQSAEDMHDLARAVDELDNVLGYSYEELGRRIRASAIAESRMDALRRLVAVAATALDEATAAVVPLEDAAQTARGVAAGHEVALLAAAESALDAEQAVLDAVAAVEEEFDVEIKPLGAARDPLSPGTATVDDEDGLSIDQRREWLANRRAAITAAQALPAEARWVQPDLVCPVPTASFTNDFHFPRSHGRRHLGTDLFADRGTPIVALASGTVTKVDTSDAFDGDHDLGGRTVSWETEVGRFYAAHLEDVAYGLAIGDTLEAGDVVGYVGDSGNARGTPPHLHLGWYVDGVAVNPWPTLAFVCDPGA